MSLKDILYSQQKGSTAYLVTFSRWRERSVWHTWNEVWGSEGGVGHTECIHRRFGPVVIHRYTVKP